jgi:cobalt-zinc-cadmium efflux system protein
VLCKSHRICGGFFDFSTGHRLKKSELSREMTHDHHTHHHHDHALTHVSKALVIGIVLNSAFVIVEAVFGFMQDSLALLSDAGHNLSDVVSLALALLAFRLAGSQPNRHYTYGYRKTTILVALFNALILIVALAGIGYEAMQRLFKPAPLHGQVMAIVAGIGILINGITAYMFIRDKERDLNIKGAYLHMAADALVSAGVVVAGLLIVWTGWYWLDPVISLVIMVVILVSTWRLLKDSLRLSMDGVPRDIDLKKVEETALGIRGILGIHHIHIWAMSTMQNALTAHLVLDKRIDWQQAGEMKQQLRHALEHLNIQHSTFEIETREEACGNKECKQANLLSDS